MDFQTRDGPPRALLIGAIVVAVGAVIAILTVAVLRQTEPEQQPVVVAAAPAPKADSSECRTLLAALPAELGEYRRARLAEPAPPGAAAWEATPSREPVVLRCGVDRPAEFVVGAPLQVVDTVQWFGVRDEERSTWFVVDRPVYVALTLPPGAGPTPIQEISRVVAKSLSAKAVDPAPVR